MNTKLDIGSFTPLDVGKQYRTSTAAKIFLSPDNYYSTEEKLPCSGTNTSGLVSQSPRDKSQPIAATEPSAIHIHGRTDRVKARFRMLRRLPANHDREGATKPNPKSIDRAITFIDRILSSPDFNATLDDDGSAVIEFEDKATRFFAAITFRTDGHVEFYKREPNKGSELFEGELSSIEAYLFQSRIELAG